MNLQIDQEFQSIIPALSPEEKQGLEQNIKTYGCRQPLDVWGDLLIDGHNRYEICQRLNIPFRTNSLEFPDRNAVKIWILRNQLDRRNLPEMIRFDLVELETELLREQGRQKQQEAGGDRKSEDYQKSLLSTVDKSDFSEPKIDTRKVIADRMGCSTGKVAMIQAVKRKATPDVKAKLATGEMSIHEVHKQIKREEKQQERAERLEQIAATPKLLIDTRLPDLVLADPPWQYRHNATHARDIENHYETATIDDIKSHAPKTQENCLLLLWVTAPKVAEAVDVMKAWGFDYRTCAVWDKEIIGMGYWFRGQHELLFVGVKGDVKPPFAEDRQSSIFTERRGEHSKKPECVYRWIEQAFPESVKLEMYCRAPRPGWQVWGNEI